MTAKFYFSCKLLLFRYLTELNISSYDIHHICDVGCPFYQLKQDWYSKIHITGFLQAESTWSPNKM